MTHATRENFDNLCDRFGVSHALARSTFADLLSRYSEPHRCYHDIAHIDRLLGWLDECGCGGDAIELAIWFHDAVYDSAARDNEARSALLFRTMLGGSLPAGLVEDVERLIRATDPARPRSNRPDEELLIDIDRAILGAGPDDYEEYCAGVRAEYSHVPDAAFAAGRSAVLREILRDAPLFRTAFFASREERARSNLERELARWESR